LLRREGVEFFIEKGLVDELAESGGLISVYMGDCGCWMVGVMGKSL
jgi:hypothetical protein